jgi:hypothetical protein
MSIFPLPGTGLSHSLLEGVEGISVGSVIPTQREKRSQYCTDMLLGWAINVLLNQY